jgi:CBS domain containing-hemolysin-like protein
VLTEWLLVLLGVVLTAGTAVFVASEFSLVTLDPGLVAAQTGPDDRRGRSVLAALRRLSTELSGAQVGITVTTVLLGYTTQPAVADLLGGPLRGSFLGEAAGGAAAVVLTLVLVNGFSMLFGELVPKNFAISHPLGTARQVAPLQRGFTAGLRPLISLFNNSANWLLRRFGVEPREELSGGRSPQELAALVRRSAQVGTLDEATATLLTNSLDFSELTAVDVMTDRQRVTVVRRDDTAAEVVRQARETGHSRFPVIGDDSDDIVGLVHLRRAIAVPYERRSEVPAAALMAEAPRVPETVRLGPLLVELRDHGLQMAVVVDEYGGTSGVVTLEDVVEELVGDVADEHDRRRSAASRRADGAWVVSGLLRPDELAETTGLVVPEDVRYETLGGLVMAALGRVPEVGDEVRAGDVRLRVEQMARRRVERVAVRPADVPDDGSGGGPADAPAERGAS